MMQSAFEIRLAMVMELKPRIESLLCQHWSEMPKPIPLPTPVPDWDLYCWLDAAGRLILVAVETGSELVGYCTFILARSQHNRNLIMASNDTIYLRPDCRVPGLADRVIEFCEVEAVRRGADVASMTVKVQHNFGPLLVRRGYENDELVFHKRLKG